MLTNTVPNLSHSCSYLLNTYYVFTCFSPFNLKRQPYEKAIFISIFPDKKQAFRESCLIKLQNQDSPSGLSDFKAGVFLLN